MQRCVRIKLLSIKVVYPVKFRSMLLGVEDLRGGYNMRGVENLSLEAQSSSG